MAMLSQCFSYYCCMESLGKLPPKRFGHHMVNVSAILRILFWGCQSRGVNLGRGGGGGRRGGGGGGGAAVVSPASGPKTPSTGLCRLFPVLSSLWRVCRNPLLLLPASHPVCWRGLAEPAPGERERAAADKGSTQREASDGGQQTARQAHRSKGPEKALRSAVCERFGDRWSRPRYRHRHTRANEQQRAALCGPVRRTRLGSVGEGAVAAPHGAPRALRQRRAHRGWRRGSVGYFYKTHLKE